MPKPKSAIAVKKIRFYPENERAYFDLLSLFRRTYNLAVEQYINDEHKDDEGNWRNLRPEIKAIAKPEFESSNRAYNSLVADNGVLAAKATFKSVCKKNKALKGASSGFSKISFKSRKDSEQTFTLDRFPKGQHPCVKALGKIKLTEKVPEECFDKSCSVTFKNGRWFIQVQQIIPLQPEIQGDVKCISVDPGVRTFATCYSDQEALIIGENLAKERLYPLMKKVDKLISRKQKVLNTQKGVLFEDMPQWARDEIRHCNRLIDTLKCKKDDILLDVHNRTAHYLVTNYDVIFLPTFETKNMVRRRGKVRTIRRNTCRQMLDLAHYKFKMRLKWYAKKYGKHVVDVNESYTSKTRSWDGTIDEKLGGKKVIKGIGFSVDRDINAARNIYIKSLARKAA